MRHSALINSNMIHSRAKTGMPRYLFCKNRGSSVLNRVPSLPLIVVGLSLLFIVIYVWLSLDERFIFGPIYSILSITLLFFITLVKKSGESPLFEIGNVIIVVSALYSAAPAIGFWVSGMTWNELSDVRLRLIGPGPREFGAFMWRNVVYLLCLAFAYLVARGAGKNECANSLQKDAQVSSNDSEQRHGRPRLVVSNSLTVLSAVPRCTKAFSFYRKREQFRLRVSSCPGFMVPLLILLISRAFSASISMYYGFYGQDRLSAVVMSRGIPYFLQQVSHNVASIGFVASLCLVVLMFAKWDSKKVLGILAVWFVAYMWLWSRKLGARSEIVALVFCAAACFHKWIRNIILVEALVGGAVAVLVLNYMGCLRDGLSWTELGLVRFLGGANEFQSVFANAYDLYTRKLTIGLDVPWQVYLNDVLALIPSQVLPFAKVGPDVWYTDLLGLRDTGAGRGFGVLSQAIIGGDWLELIVRGIVVGWVAARVHRWYEPRSSEFWPTLLYILVSYWSFYTYRVTTFHIVYKVIYNFLPFMLIVKWLSTQSNPSIYKSTG